MATKSTDTYTTFFAHSSDESQEKWQRLFDHLKNTAEKSADLGKPIGMENLAYITGFLHDLGKYTQNFQARLHGKQVAVDHSTAGAQEIVNYYKKSRFEPIAHLIAYCISGHHTGLPDMGTSIDLEGDPTLQARLKRKIEPYSAYQQEIDIDSLPKPIPPMIKKTSKSGFFSLSFLTRMLYSILVDADYLETESFYSKDIVRGAYPSPANLQNLFQQALDSKQFPQSPINDLRQHIRQACEERAGDEQGLFSLTVPTGGGKTISSMQFALLHAKKHNLQRIIYVIPYTSIIEQNAKVFKEMLGYDCVLEHHSNFDWEQFSKEQSRSEDADDSVTEKLRLASENWDIPIVVTTNVQFFESLYASRSSSSRKVHNMANSVILFDEAQMIPNGFIKPCLLAISELVLNYKSTVVLCTATQPEFSRFLPDDIEIKEIMPNPTQLYDAFKRVSIQDAGTIDDETLAKRLSEHHQALCIVNTRKHAQKIFNLLPKSDHIFHLSTLMYPAHRQQVIATIKDRLNNNQPCIVISTQVMEAGVDLDFPVGYRALAGLDSIIQAGGRVNRNRKSADAKLYIFEPDTDAIKRVPGYIQQTGDITRQILRRWKDKDPICLEAIQDYYESLYGVQSDHAFDSARVLPCFEKPSSRLPSFDFRTASERFKLIGSDTIAVIVPRESKAQDILDKLPWVQSPGALLRKLQIYTVSIYRNEFLMLYQAGKIDMKNDTIPVLLDPETNYHPCLGLSIPTNAGGDALFDS